MMANLPHRTLPIFEGITKSVACVITSPSASMPMPPGNDIASPPTSLAAGRMTAIRPAQIEASLQRISQGVSTPDDADLWRAVWDALQTITKALGIKADVLRSPDEAILMIQYQEIAPVEETMKE